MYFKFIDDLNLAILLRMISRSNAEIFNSILQKGEIRFDYL